MFSYHESHIQLIEPYELAYWMDHESDTLIIVDVRDNDFEGYKIPGSRSIPFYNFSKTIPVLIKNLKSLNPVPTKIVFHCMYCYELYMYFFN